MIKIGFTALLRPAWVAATVPILVASLPIRPVGFLHRMLMRFAARGKIMKNTSSRFTVPQRYFLHFYLVALALTTFLVLSTWFYAYRKMLPLTSNWFSSLTVASGLIGGSDIFSFQKAPFTTMEHKHKVWRTLFVLLLMEVQVLRRLYETIYVFHYSPSARMHFLGYLTGLFFYIMAPLSLGVACAPEALSYLHGQIVEFIVKGRERMPDLHIDWLELLKPFIYLGWSQWMGALIFFWGWLHQHRCHEILGSLRENKGKDEYVIPHGDWFAYVSCPHYLAEIIIYFGILVASGGSDLTIWLLFMFVVSNLVFAAAETHRWYHQKFEKYPKTRRAIIPFIY
ncbi:polyprenol reductase 1 isoform X2 [Canna indica]|uniref:Polyprenol reductase 1 isoform X2 n=1 Tax=Canna indica TaxID=4628 RepID=A0AAQ3KC79_9LILI|nr:polyprenol reductase 1 isoform X2 [Canna indica]